MVLLALVQMLLIFVFHFKSFVIFDALNIFQYCIFMVVRRLDFKVRFPIAGSVIHCIELLHGAGISKCYMYLFDMKEGSI